jgi:hypothetical protein
MVASVFVWGSRFAEQVPANQSSGPYCGTWPRACWYMGRRRRGKRHRYSFAEMVFCQWPVAKATQLLCMPWLTQFWKSCLSAVARAPLGGMLPFCMALFAALALALTWS